MSDETPTDHPAPEAPAPAPAPVAAPAATAPAGPRTVAVPRWLLIALAAVIGALAMFGLGYAVGDSGNDSDGAAVSRPALRLPERLFDRDDRTPRAPRTAPGPQRPSTPAAAPFLGVATRPVDNGLEITQVVPGSGAAAAGLQVGDVITTFDGDPVTNPAQLASAVARQEPGDKVEVAYTRDGRTRTVTVTIGTRGTTNSN